MKFLKYNIDSQSFENIYILNILNTSYRSNYIYSVPKRFYSFDNLLQSYYRLPKQHTCS